MIFRVPRIMALADGLPVFCYALDLSPIYGQVVALALKVLVLPLLVRPGSLAMRHTEAFIILASTCGLSLAFGEGVEWIDIAAASAFLVNLFLTLLLTRDQLGDYLRTVTYVLVASALLYIAMALIGSIPIIWGRYFYFYGLQPNLGAEIAAGGVLCAVISMKYRPFLAVSVIFLLNTVLMEGRSALLAIVFMVAIRSVHETIIAKDRSRTELKIIVAIPFVTAIAAFAMPYIFSALLINDRHRGFGTGVVGRADQWRIAWDAFRDRPLTGQGLGWFDRTQELGAHNFFFYGLAEMGLLSVVLFVMLGWMAVTAFRVHGWKVLSLSPVLILLLFNDRYINLNPYPYMMWVLAFALSAQPKSQAAGALVPPAMNGALRAGA